MVNDISIMISEEDTLLKPNIELRIAEYRSRTGHKIENQQLAEMLGITKHHFSACVNDRAYLKMDKAFKLAKILGCKVDDLYVFEEEEK